MKPDWDKLGDKYADSDSVTIADVDCTDKKGESLCGKYGVKGYPTVKYKLADEKSFKDYQGAREFGPLKDFVDKTFKKPCDIKTKKGCAPNEVEFIDKWADKSAEEVAEERANRDTELKQIRKEKADAQAELRKKEKEWTKKEKLISKSLSLLKGLEKQKKAEL
jgi:thioredoxin-like negative regulator of GroEL